MPNRALRLVLVLLSVVPAALAGCAQNINQIVTCETDEDCPAGYCDEVALICLQGQRECETDRECGAPAGICDRARCVAGCPVRACDLGETCNEATGRCRFLQSCTLDSQCDPPDRICLDTYCEVGCGTTGCASGLCDPYSGHCQGGGECTGDAGCSPPATICEDQACVPGCATTGCGDGEDCSAATGRCVPEGGCGSDAGCSPPATICEDQACVPGCLSTGCGLDLACNPTTGRCDPAAGCTTDAQCDPPSTICLAPDCVPGCLTTGCGLDLACNPTTGRCDPVATAKADGEDCAGADECQSGLCTEVDVLNPPGTFHVCSRACCTENDCAAHHACLYHRGVKQCIPDRIFPAPYYNNFTAGAGQVCGNAGPFCRSGYCIPADEYNPSNTCGTTCCAAADCGGGECVWYGDGSGFVFELCADTLATGHTGTTCTSEYDCASLICVGVCADMCCANSDCPNGTVCAQVLSGQSEPMVTTACLSGGGSVADGAACTPGDAPSWQCDSGLCAGGTCRRPCCHTIDCPTGQSCQVVSSGIDIDNDGTADLVRACIPDP